MPTAINPTLREIRLPHITRDKTSLPRSSVPKRCAVVGGERTLYTLIVAGPYGAISGANSATVASINIIINPATDKGFSLNRLHIIRIILSPVFWGPQGHKIYRQ